MPDRAVEILAEACGPDLYVFAVTVARSNAINAVRAALEEGRAEKAERELTDHACPVPEDYSKALAEMACARDKAERELAEARSLLDPRIAVAALGLVENAERHPDACCSKCAAGLAERDEARAALKEAARCFSWTKELGRCPHYAQLCVLCVSDARSEAEIRNLHLQSELADAQAEVVKLTARERRHPGYVIGDHWLETAYDRICGGEEELAVLADYGWVRVAALGIEVKP